jgi:two-component system response regulator EvgA
MEGNISTVLIVDDDSAFRKFLRTLFEHGGFEFCAEATSGMEAIEKAKHLSPNLVILDFSMPGMDGLQLARNLWTIMPELTIFMLTADRSLHIEKEALSCGISAVFSKLDDLETLLTNARVVCGIK